MKPLVVLLLFFNAAIIGFGYTKYNETSEKLTRIERKLGGPEKLNCNSKEAVEKAKKSVVRIIGGESEGTGFVANGSGTIVTNFHVIEFEPSPKVILPNNDYATAEIRMVDKDADIAILNINKPLPELKLGDSTNVDINDDLYVLGFPFGSGLSGEVTVNKGSLSAKRKLKDTDVEYLQTDATLNRGVSGGPMLNECGDVVGVNTLGTSGLGLAISSASLSDKWLTMLSASDPLDGIKKIEFNTDTPLSVVQTFYNYLKIKKLEKAYILLSKNFTQQGYEDWEKGYDYSLDTSLVSIREDEKDKNKVFVKLSSKDLDGEEIVYKFYEGCWIVKEEDGLKLWDAEIEEVIDPGFFWFYEE